MDRSKRTNKRKPLSQLAVCDDANVSSKRSRVCEDESSGCEKRAGTITYMVLKNFMCHSLLEVNFENNVSIIIGRNGSGKSAILTALIVGLGGKASLTNRGTSVKGFIKAGKNSGSVEIHLCNEGPMAYRPSVYGNSITVIRNFSASGSGNYRIKSAQGAVISTQAREIQNITASLNIQVDNPICILNQDVSRNFLSSNDPKHKFTLFMKATKLETLAEEYKKINDNKKECLRIISDKQVNFENLQNEIKRLKRKIDGHKSIVSLKDKKNHLQKELMWAKVRDSESDLDDLQKNLDKIQRDHDGFKAKADSRTQAIAQIDEQIQEIRQEISELKQAIEVQTRPQIDTQSIIDDLRKTNNEKKRERNSLQTTIESRNKDMEFLRKEISQANENMTRVEQAKMARLRELTTLEEKIKGAEDHLQTSRNDLFQIKNDLSRKEEEEQNLLREISTLDTKISAEQRNLNALQRETGNKLLLYGQDMPRVKQMIQQNRHRFVHEPRGPVGEYIKLKDKKWAVAVEGYLTSGTLSGFLVDNSKDNQVLREIFSQVWQGRTPPITTVKFLTRKHDVSRNLVQAPPDCVSLYDALEVEDVVVSNSLVDSSSIESILLIPSNERAIELLSHQQNVPRNCSQGVTIKGDKFYPDPNYKTYGSRYHNAKFLQVDTKQHLIQLQHNINSLTTKKHGITNQLEAFRSDMRGQVNRKNQLEDKIKKLNLAKTQIRRQLEELKSTAEPEVASVHVLETELEQIKTTLNEHNAQLGKLVDEIKEVKNNIVDNEIKLKKLKESTKGLEERLQPLEQNILENSAKKREIVETMKFDRNKIHAREKDLNEVQAQIQVKKISIKKQTDDASKLGERLPELRTVHDISHEIQEVDRSIARIETDSENVADVMDRYNELHAKYRVAADIMKSLKTDLEELSSAVLKRNKHYKLTESYFITYMKHSFKKVLEFRQFKGNINIDMNAKKLDLIVIPQQGSQGLTNTSNLSGGERSFSTVAFLYALWQCMEFPFYFLDEFDVYMDKLNRTKVIDILLHHASTRPQLQFVFLTPQDVSFINKNVSLLRLQDPERFNL